MKFRYAFLALGLLATPAIAQQPPNAQAMITALQKTDAEHVQAWVATRALNETLQQQHEADQQKIATLEAKLPRQEPVHGPSTYNVAPDASAPSSAPSSPATGESK